MSSPDYQPTLPTPVLDATADALDTLLTIMSDGSDSEAVQRDAVVNCLREISALMDQASGIWQSYAENPVQEDDQYTAVMWIGPERSRDLHRIRLQIRDLARQLSAAGGVAFHDTIGFSQQLDVVDAYAQLMPDETGATRARSAIETIGNRRAGVEDAIARLS